MIKVTMQDVLEWAEKLPAKQVVYTKGYICSECVMANYGTDVFATPVEAGYRTLYKGSSDTELAEMEDELVNVVGDDFFSGITAGEVVNILSERII
jgi:hypothetical protein